MNVKREFLLPIVTGILAIMAERWIYNHSPAVRALVGADRN
jgi:hypothetical protein